MKHLVAYLFIAALIVFGAPVSKTYADTYAQQHLLLGTSSAGGTYYNLGAGWSNIIGQSLKNIDVSCEVTAGPTTNIQLIDKKDMDLGIATAWVGGEAFTGTGWAQKHGAYKTVLGLFPTHSSYLYIYTLKDSGINTIYDFAGKNIAVSTAGSTSDLAGRAILEILGIKPANLSRLPSTSQVNSIKDGTIDAVFGVTGSPAPWLLDLETTHDFKFIQLGKDDFAKISKAYPFWSIDVIPANTYKNQTAPYTCFSFWNFFVAQKDLAEDVVYDLVKTTFEHTDDLLKVSKSAAGVNLKNISKITIPLHPGAVRYYKEKGLDISEKASK